MGDPGDIGPLVRGRGTWVPRLWECSAKVAEVVHVGQTDEQRAVRGEFEARDRRGRARHVSAESL